MIDRFGVSLFGMALCATAAAAQQEIVAQLSFDRLADLSLEQLGRINVSSVSRHEERLLQAPASVYVVTSDDIRRSGARTLPEALRLAPNLQVARTSAGQWAISARGFNNAIGNKLLVLVDGRTIYSPLFSGVFWDAQDVMLEDVEQIEVISGPGGTLWGANAVNGVINITTRPARDTQGGLVAVTAGGDRRDTSVRYGGKIGDDAAFRIYAMNLDRDHTTQANGVAVADGSRKKQAGWRIDWGPSQDGFTLQGDTYSGGSGPGAPDAPVLSGTNVLARWTRQLDDGANWRLQGYFDHSHRDDPLTFRDDMDIFDVEWQHNLAPAQGHRLMWGAGWRTARDRTDASFLVSFDPAQRRLGWTNVFAQDEIALAPHVRATAGAKFERNVYTGWEFLPSARLSWTPTDTQLGWMALSRAVRAPARLDREFFFPGHPPFFIVGGPNFQSEVANVLELGWRAQPTPALSYSVTIFHNQYDRLRSGASPPATVQNMIEGHTQGLEAWCQWQVAPNWRLSAGLNELREHLRLKAGSPDPVGPSALGNDPRYQWQLRSSTNLTGRQEFDIGVRRVGALPQPAVPAYTAVDARWGWRVSSAVEVSLTIQNLLDRNHTEFGDPATASQSRRTGWLKLLWQI
ncbi:MAG TPA: TonB-dependent receptor [Ramlibacter sp.]|nr:TonB-dependent receptor [Ramlibacter sp.]